MDGEQNPCRWHESMTLEEPIACWCHSLSQSQQQRLWSSGGRKTKRWYIDVRLYVSVTDRECHIQWNKLWLWGKETRSWKSLEAIYPYTFLSASIYQALMIDCIVAFDDHQTQDKINVNKYLDAKVKIKIKNRKNRVIYIWFLRWF